MSTVEASTQIVVSLGQAIAIVSAVGSVLVGAIGLLFKGLLHQVQVGLNKRFEELAEQGDAWRALERDFLNLRIELPEKYLRREDHIRGQTVLEAKLDALASEVKVVQIQGAKRESQSR